MGQRETPWNQRDGERLCILCTMEPSKYILKIRVTDSLSKFFVDVKEGEKLLIWPA